MEEDEEASKNVMERGTIQEKDQRLATATEMVRLASDNLYSHVLDRSFHDSLYKIGRNNAIEQMINAGRADVAWLDDDWTVVTEDGSLSAHYENTILITDGEPEILTLY